MGNVKRCPGCKGQGKIDCPICNGRGKVSPRGILTDIVPAHGGEVCRTCQGTGRILCDLCKGVGKIQDC